MSEASGRRRRVLVTGAAGFIGSNLAQRLARDGHGVVAADAFEDGDARNLVECLRHGGDVLALPDRQGIAAMRDAGPFEVIYHQAAITGVIDADGTAMTGPAADRLMLLNNVEQFRGLLSLAADTGAAMIYASSCSVYGRGPVPMRESAPIDPLNSYALSKAAMENLAHKFAPRLASPPVGLRYSNAYGPGESHKGPLASMPYKLARQMRQGTRPRIFEHGQQRRDFVYVDDCVSANLAATEATLANRLEIGVGHVFNAGAGRSWTFNELVAELNRVLGTDLPPDYFANPYDFTQDHTETDPSLAAEKIGHEPRFDLAAGLDAYAAGGRLGT